MFRMIVVDDEAIVRAGISRIVEWAEFGIEIVGEAADGAQALKLVEELHPDLMILDIEIPVFNGLEVLERLQKLPDAPKVIVLSGYDNFEYVRRSMKLGAQNYLLKPVDVEELGTTISDTIDAINDIAARKMQFSETLSALRNHTLNRLLNGQIELKELREKCKLIGITLRSNHMQVWMLRPLFDNEDVSLRHIMFDTLEICDSLSREYGYTGYFVADSDDNIAGIITAQEVLPDEAAIEAFLNECARRLYDRCGCRCVVSYGLPVTLYRDLPQSYRQALSMQGYRRICLDEPDFLAPDAQTDSPLFDENDLAEALRSGNIDHTRTNIQTFCKNLQVLQAGNLPVAKYHAVAYLSHAIQSISRFPVSSHHLRRFRDQAYMAIHDARDIRALESALCRLLEQLMELTVGEPESVNVVYSPIVRSAIQTAKHKYGDINLSIKTLAAEMNVSAAYLGRQFKQETGQFFTDYLNNLRIMTACSLLSETTMRVADIAESVGFSNISYFHTVFKKYAGCAPGALRRQGEKTSDKSSE